MPAGASRTVLPRLSKRKRVPPEVDDDLVRIGRDGDVLRSDPSGRAVRANREQHLDPAVGGHVIDEEDELPVRRRRIAEHSRWRRRVRCVEHIDLRNRRGRDEARCRRPSGRSGTRRFQGLGSGRGHGEREGHADRRRNPDHLGAPRALENPCRTGRGRRAGGAHRPRSGASSSCSRVCRINQTGWDQPVRFGFADLSPWRR